MNRIYRENRECYVQYKNTDKRFIEIMDEQLDVIPFEFSEMFIDGFKLGQR